jgi:hypothetical protein
VRAVAVFIASKHTNPALLRVLWFMPEADARAVCADPRTAGDRYGLHWTASYGEQGQAWEYVPDDGRFAALLLQLGVTVTGPGKTQREPRRVTPPAAAGTGVLF